jgi:hypothetical protein
MAELISFRATERESRAGRAQVKLLECVFFLPHELPYNSSENPPTS